MANYVATTRSNYFEVKDIAAFEDWCASRNLSHWRKDDCDPAAPLYAIADENGDGWPSSIFDDEADEVVDIDLAAELAAHLAPGNVAVLIEVGFEKLRYLVGVAVAVHPDGRTLTTDLADIYDKASATFGVAVTQAMF